MSDLALAFDGDIAAADLCLAAGDLVLDDGLGSLVLASLLTDARAGPDELDPGERDRRGWWGDALEQRGPWGGKLWLLHREKTRREILRRAEDYASGALQWMIADGIAERVAVIASRIDGEGDGATLVLEIEIVRPSGERVQLLYDRLWRATA